jgi:hypothetical protein
MKYLRQGTAGEEVVGPIVDYLDGVTPKTSLTLGDITAAIIKNVTRSTITLTATGGDNDFVHLGDGYWKLELTAANKDTLGPFRVTFRDEDVFKPLHEDFMVVTAPVYDAFFATGETLAKTIEKLDAMIAYPNQDHYELSPEAVTQILAVINGYYGTIYSMMEDGGGYYKLKDQALGFLNGLLFENSWMERVTFKDGGQLVSEDKLEVYDSKTNAQTHDGSTGLKRKLKRVYTWDAVERLLSLLTTKEA